MARRVRVFVLALLAGVITATPGRRRRSAARTASCGRGTGGPTPPPGMCVSCPEAGKE
jgi:hypothetical protein